MKYKDLALKYKYLMKNDMEEQAVGLVLLEFGRRIMDLTDPTVPGSQDRAFNIINRRANDFIKRYKLNIPKNFVITYLKNKGNDIRR